MRNSSLSKLEKNENHRKRVLAATNHKPADRFPLTIGSPSSSLHKRSQVRLLNFLKLKAENHVGVTDNILQISETDQRIIKYFDIDLLWILPKVENVQWNNEKTGFIDAFGRQFIECGGFFNQVGAPLENCSQKSLRLYRFPEFENSRFSHLGSKAEKFYEKGFGLGIDGPWGLFEISSSLTGSSEYLMNLVLNPKLCRDIAQAVLENYLIPFYDNLLADTADYVQVIGISDDLGGQNGLIFSPKTYRKIFKPLHEALIEFIKSRTNAKIIMHSDGSIFPIIPDLIEIGVQGLNPVQYSAKNMDLNILVNEFGKDLIFFGGTIENSVLSFSTPDKIREIVHNNIDVLNKQNGFIFAPIHNISQEVPPENVIALYEAGIEFG